MKGVAQITYPTCGYSESVTHVNIPHNFIYMDFFFLLSLHHILHCTCTTKQYHASPQGESDKNKFLHQQGAFSFPCSIPERLCGPTVTTLPPCRCGNETGPINSPGSWE